MHNFKDSTGREWRLVINVNEVKRVRAALGIDLANVISIGKDGAVVDGFIDRLANDPCLLVDILWVLVEAQAKEAGISDVEFGSSLAGESIETATRAFLDELVDFFPGARHLFLKKILELIRTKVDAATASLGQVLESPEFAEAAKEFLNSSTSSPASSESTPAPSPSGN